MKINSGARVARPAPRLSGVDVAATAVPCARALKLRVS
jgi:hypothetical protein